MINWDDPVCGKKITEWLEGAARIRSNKQVFQKLPKNLGKYPWQNMFSVIFSVAVVTIVQRFIQI